MAIPTGMKLVVVIPCDFIPAANHSASNPPKIFQSPESGKITPGMDSLTDVELAAVKQLVQLCEDGDDGIAASSMKNHPSNYSSSSSSIFSSTNSEKMTGKRPTKRRYRSISTLYRITSQIKFGSANHYTNHTRSFNQMTLLTNTR